MVDSTWRIVWFFLQLFAINATNICIMKLNFLRTYVLFFAKRYFVCPSMRKTGGESELEKQIFLFVRARSSWLWLIEYYHVIIGRRMITFELHNSFYHTIWTSSFIDFPSLLNDIVIICKNRAALPSFWDHWIFDSVDVRSSSVLESIVMVLFRPSATTLLSFDFLWHQHSGSMSSRNKCEVRFLLIGWRNDQKNPGLKDYLRNSSY